MVLFIKQHKGTEECSYQTVHTIECLDDIWRPLPSLVVSFSKLGCNNMCFYTKRQ